MENNNGKRLYQVAEIQLSYKSDAKPSLRPNVNGSKDACNVLQENWDDSQIEFIDQFKVLRSTGHTKCLEFSKFQMEVLPERWPILSSSSPLR